VTAVVSVDERFGGLAWDRGLLARVGVLPTARAGSLVTASGQVAVKSGELVARGLVGEEVDLETAQVAAWLCALNVLDAVRSDVGSLDRVKAHRITVYVASSDGFTDQHLVAHGASAALLEVLGPDRGRHTRAALGLKALPLGSPVEVDGVFQVHPD
jgi:enamine deaminase RidA (YjgF/YER057c/UK114 family)